MTTVEASVRPREQTRARYPDEEGYVERDGVRVFYEAYGEGEPTVFLLPTWSIIHSRHWKLQIAYLARHFRVLTFDGRGNGKADRPTEMEAYTEGQFAEDALAVLDATRTERAAIVGVSCGALWGTLLAADHPERVSGAVFIGSAVPLAPPHPERQVYSFEERLDTDEGWAKYNRHYWLEHHEDFLQFFFAKIFAEPHSTKQIEDCVGWGLEMAPETLIACHQALELCGLESFRDVCARVRCPVLVLHGDEDAIRPLAQGAALAETIGGTLVTLEGSGHCPHVRDPVKVNLLIRDFVESLERRPAWPS
jgi:pimeloyl-ACP methyl ester carboxylesterase